MRKINLSFGKYSDADLLVQAQATEVALTGNSYFPTTSPTIAEFQTFITSYSGSLSAAKDRSKNNVAAKNAARLALTNAMVSLAMDLMKTANGDLQALISTALPLNKQRQPLPPLDKPQILKMEDGINSGDLLVTIAAVLGARTFVYQYTLDPITDDTVWQGQNATTCKVLLSNLEPGKRYWIRVIAYGINEQEVYSEVILSPIIR